MYKEKLKLEKLGTEITLQTCILTAHTHPYFYTFGAIKANLSPSIKVLNVPLLPWHFFTKVLKRSHFSLLLVLLFRKQETCN